MHNCLEHSNYSINVAFVNPRFSDCISVNLGGRG